MFAASELPSASLASRDILYRSTDAGRNGAEIGALRPYVGYGQFWGVRSGSGLVLGSGHGLAVAEADTANDLGEAVGAVQSAPVALG